MKTEDNSKMETDKTPWTAPWAKKAEARKKETGYEQQLLPVPRQRTYYTSCRGILMSHAPRRDEYMIKQDGETFLKDSKGCEKYQWHDWWGTIERIQEQNRKNEAGEVSEDEEDEEEEFEEGVTQNRYPQG
jgi:hypothetical protein